MLLGLLPMIFSRGGDCSTTHSAATEPRASYGRIRLCHWVRAGAEVRVDMICYDYLFVQSLKYFFSTPSNFKGVGPRRITMRMGCLSFEFLGVLVH